MVLNTIKVVVVTLVVALNTMSVTGRVYHSIVRSDDRWSPIGTATSDFSHRHPEHTATAVLGKCSSIGESSPELLIDANGP